jgi:hypothetical protein
MQLQFLILIYKDKFINVRGLAKHRSTVFLSPLIANPLTAMANKNVLYSANIILFRY